MQKLLLSTLVVLSITQLNASQVDHQKAKYLMQALRHNWIDIDERTKTIGFIGSNGSYQTCTMNEGSELLKHARRDKSLKRSYDHLVQSDDLEGSFEEGGIDERLKKKLKISRQVVVGALILKRFNLFNEHVRKTLDLEDSWSND